MRKLFTKNIFVLLVILLASCVAQATHSYDVQTQSTSDPEVYLPLISTPASCTATARATTAFPSTALAPSASTAASPEDTVSGHSYYVTTNGSSSADGSAAHPWDLDSALLNTSKVTGGDTIWVRGGTYHPTREPSKYNIKVGGSSNNPVTVRAYPGERVTLDARIEIYEQNLVFWGFEVMSSSTDRTSEQSGSAPSDVNRSGGIGVYAPNVALINNVLHDGKEGIVADSDAPNMVIYGNLSYNAGWQGPDRGHGHGIYTQNQNGSKLLADNIVFNNFGRYSFHSYTEGGYLNNFTFSGNIVMNDEFLVGGLQPANNITLDNNMVYNAKVQMGFDARNNTNLTLTNNLIWNPSDVSLKVDWWNAVTMTNNCLIGGSESVVELQYPSSVQAYTWNNNLYQSSKTKPFSLSSSTRTWDQWKGVSGYDGSSNFSANYPGASQVFVLPNQYEAKRGNIVIFNYAHANSISVDISKLGLQSGDRYTLHNAQNYFTETISGTYNGGPVNIPMTGWSVAVPIGWNEALHPSTFPDFGAFVLTTP